MQPPGSSAVYVVKISKATQKEIKALSDTNAQILTEIQFLEHLVRNKNDALKQALFYVNFQSNPTTSNSSKSVNPIKATNPIFPTVLDQITTINAPQRTNPAIIVDINRTSPPIPTPIYKPNNPLPNSPLSDTND